ncbi:MAG: flavin reductase family protein [Rhodobacteraceae bacterium]|nr:flavin reductase family protein [Paracoccaceae bacterium]
MFYRPGLDPHGLAHNPFKALVAPRPIGWISSLDAEDRVNLAPYSFFNAIADAPPMVMYSSNGRKTGLDEGKDTVANIRATGEFVANIVSFALRDAMNASSGHYPAGEDEFGRAGLTPAPSRVVAPPRVAEAPAALECRAWKVIDLPGAANVMVIGEVVGVHISDAVLANGRVDVTRYQPLARLGYRDYAAVREVFALSRPGER